ncbi:MAG: PAS domain-containing sensor histidine kinase, partial [Halobacteria archaeon]|nr:PAS domain-containing sensor histidine kinase [Halobacteria archaeon]
VFEDASKVEYAYSQDTPEHSTIFVPVGDYGVLVAADLGKKDFDNRSVELAETLAATAEAVFAQKERERELEKYESIIQNTTDSVIIKGLENRFQFVNEAACENFGMSEKELLGSTTEELLGEELAEVIRERDEKVRETESAINYETRVEIAGEDRTYKITRMPHYDHEGELAGIIIISRDLTERQEMEDELGRRNEMLDEFAGVVSHDLRNPLGVAKGRLDMIDEECESEHIEPLENALDRMETLIDNLLDLARQGDKFEHLEPVALDDVVEGSWGNVDSKGASLRSEVPDTNTSIMADRNRVKQVFENLFRNSVEHNEEPVTITVGVIDRGFYVEDDGEGIPEGERDKIFNSGYTTNKDGTGFGLSIVKQIVEAHDWEIEAKESDDGGARFEVTGVEFK